jgi:hypothetical protein
MGVAVLLLIAAIVGLVFFLGDDEETAPEEASTGTSYRLSATDDRDPSEEDPESLHFELTAALNVSLPEEQPDGVSIDVDVDDVVMTFDGVESGPVAISQLQSLRIDDRGEPDAIVIVAADSTGAFFYFIDVLFPVIPSGTGSEGDTWQISFEAGVPAGTGTAAYVGTGELLGFEEVSGINAARITNDLTFEYDFTMQASELAALSGLGPPTEGSTRVTGSGSMTLTGWVDLETNTVLRVEVEGRYDVVFGPRGFDPNVFEQTGDDIPSNGSFTYTLGSASTG